MRTTVRIEDDLLRKLKRQAEREKSSLTEMVNQAIRRGLEPSPAKRRRYRQKTSSMGPPLINLNKALAFADMLEDEAILQKMAQGK